MQAVQPTTNTATESAADPFTTELLAARATAIRTLHRIANSLDAPLLDQSHPDIREARLASLAILKIPFDCKATADSGSPSQSEGAGGWVRSDSPSSQSLENETSHSPSLREGAGGREQSANEHPQTATLPTPHPVPERSDAPRPRPLIPLPSIIPRGKDLLAVVGSARSRAPDPKPFHLPAAIPRAA